jgi:hypothetical protein
VSEEEVMAAINWLKSKVEAFSLAKAQGKKVLLLAGNRCCDGTLFMRDKACEWTTPADVKGLIEQHFIPWYGGAYYSVPGCVGDPVTTDWNLYAPKGQFTMPLIVVIDPVTDKAMYSSTGVTPRVVGNPSQFDNQKFYSLLSQCVTGDIVTPPVVPPITPPVVSPVMGNVFLYFPHITILDGWQTEICILNTGHQPVKGMLTFYNATGKVTGSQPIVLPVFGRKQILCNNDLVGIVVDYAVFSAEFSSVQGYTIFWKPGKYSSTLAAVAEGKTSGVFAKIEKNGGWTGIAFINTEVTPASVTLTAYTDAGVVVGIKAFIVSGNGKVVDHIEKLFTGDISKATYVAYLSDKKVAGFELLGSVDEKMLDGFNTL